MKLLVLSDLHLGTGASRAAEWLDGIRRIARQYDRVILNGDTLDRCESENCEPHTASMLMQVREACRARNAEAELLTGNHDPAASTQQWIYDPNSASLIFHGDCVADLTHPTKRADQMLAGRLREQWARLGERPPRFTELIEAFRKTQGQFLRENPPVRERVNALQYLASVAYPPQKPFHILGYWRRAPRLAAQLAATFDRPVRYAVVGHTHRAGSWEHHGVRVINTGSFMPLSKPHAVCIDGLDVTLRPLEALLRTHRTVSSPTAPSISAPAPAKIPAVSSVADRSS